MLCYANLEMLGPAHPLLKEFGCSSAILIVPFTSFYCRINPNNCDEAGDDITGFGWGLPILGFYGGWNPGLQPSAQQYPFFQGGWTAALNQGFMPLPTPASSPAPHAQNQPVAATVEC
jgi:hypothetical protein